jgi:hypothetical protein
VFKNNHVHSIYKKGLIREERMNREDIVEVKDFKVQRIENPTNEFVESVWEKSTYYDEEREMKKINWKNLQYHNPSQHQYTPTKLLLKLF